MLKPFCFFFSAGRPHGKALLAGALVAWTTLFAEASPPAVDASALPPALPELAVIQAGHNSADHEIRIGDRITFQVALGTLQTEASGPLILEPPKDTPKPEDAGWFLDPSTLSQGGTLRFVASPLKGGEIALPSLLVSDSSGRPIAKTAPLNLKVLAPVDSKTGEPDLVDVIPISLPLRFWILFAFLFALVVAGSVWMLRKIRARRRNRKPKDLPLVPKEPDHVIALRKLDLLFDSGADSDDHLKRVSFGTSEILKEFFSKRFGIDAMESTTGEMLLLLKRKESMGPQQLDEIRQLFEELDLYKFTKTQQYLKNDPLIREDLKIRARLLVQKWALVIREAPALA